MLEYVTSEDQIYVITTLISTWGIGPMYNGSIKPNMEIVTFWTSKGLEFGLRACRDINKGEHLTWNYNSNGKKNTYGAVLNDLDYVIEREDQRERRNRRD